MASWLQSQLKVAENLLDAVDKTVSKTIVRSDGTTGASSDGGDGSQTTPKSNVTQRADSQEPTSASSTPFARAPSGSGVPFGINVSRSAASTPTAPAAHPSVPSTSSTPTHTTPQPTTPFSDTRPPSASHSYPLPHPPPTTQSSPFPPAPIHNTDPPPNTPSAPPAPLPEPTPSPNPLPPSSHTSQTPNMQPRPSISPSASSQDLSSTDPSTSATARDHRLSRLVEQFKKRLEESRAENQQLEEMLQVAEQQAGEYKARASSAQAQLEALQEERSTAEDVYQAAVTAKDVQCQRLKLSLDEAQGQVAQLQAQVALLEESRRQVMESKGELEGSMLQALRNDVRVAEQQLDSERKAHQASKAAAAARQLELEGHLSDNAAALAGMQHRLEETGQRYRAMEEQWAVLQVTNAALEQRATAAEAAAAAAGAAPATPDAAQRAHGGEGASGVEVEALRRELSRQRTELQRAERARRTAETEAARLNEQLVAAQEQAAPMSPGTRGAEARVKEMAEMLYIKQTQLEKLASDKAAQQIVLERELAGAREEAARLRGLLQRHQDASGTGPHDVIPMDTLGEPYQRLLRHNQFGGAVRTAAGFLDNTASSAAHMLRQYPLVRLGIFGYAVALHLYLWYITVRMQHIAISTEVQGLEHHRRH